MSNFHLSLFAISPITETPRSVLILRMMSEGKFEKGENLKKFFRMQDEEYYTIQHVADKTDFQQPSPQSSSVGQPTKFGPTEVRLSLLQALELDSSNPSDLESLDELLTTLDPDDIATFLPPDTPPASLKMAIHLASAKRAVAESAYDLQLAQAKSAAAAAASTGSPPPPAFHQDHSEHLPASLLQFDGTAMGQGASRRPISVAKYFELFHQRCVAVGLFAPADQGRALLRLLTGPAEALIHQGLPQDPVNSAEWRAHVAKDGGPHLDDYRRALARHFPSSRDEQRLYAAAVHPVRPPGLGLAGLQRGLARAWRAYERSGGALSQEHKYQILAERLLPEEAAAFHACAPWPAIAAHPPGESAAARAARFARMLGALLAFCESDGRGMRRADEPLDGGGGESWARYQDPFH